MDSYKCPMCNQKAIEPINLRCDHHPCFQCASQIITVDHESTLETKYKIVCTVCHKKTITYDLRHLIINNTQQQQDMYVTSKFINKKPQISLSKKTNNYFNQSKTNVHSKNNSSQSLHLYNNNNNKPITIQCKKHQGYNLQYYCQQCIDKNQCNVFLCSQCTKNHKHRLINIYQAIHKINQLNNKKKQNVIFNKYPIINQYLNILTQKKQNIHNQYQNLYRQVTEQFKNLYNFINQQYQSIKKDIKNIYNKQCDQLKNNISITQRLCQGVKQLQKIHTQNYNQIQSQIQYTMCVLQLQKAIQINKSKLCQKFQIPQIYKRNSFPILSSQKIIQIQFVRHKQKQVLKSVTPTNSARFFNYNLDSCRNSKNQKGIDINLVKQNFNPISPKNYFSSKPNI